MTAPTPVVIGLDVGTTAVKAVAVEPGTGRRVVAERLLRTDEPAPGHQVQDPGEVLDRVVEALAACVRAAGHAEVRVVSVAAAMHGLVALDGRDRPLTPLVTWADGRAGAEALALRDSGEATALHRSTGVPVHPMSPLVKLRWFARHDPDTWRRARRWVGLKELVLHRLTGTWVVDESSAAGTGLRSLDATGWDDAALACCGLDVELLPEVVPPTSLRPLATGVARAVGLPGGAPVCVGAADGPLGNLGVGALDPGVAALNLGTSAALRATLDEPRVDPEGALFCYPLADGLWALGGALSNGGDVVGWMAGVLEPPTGGTARPGDGAHAASTIAALAEQAPPGCDGLVMVPWLLPERAPSWDAELSGAYLGLGRRHTRAHLARAAIEGVARQLRSVLDVLVDVEPVVEVRAAGGAFASPVWRQAVAAALGRPLQLVDEAAGTAMGAAALGLRALGAAPDLAAARRALDAPGNAPTLVTPDPTAVAALAGQRLTAARAAARLADALGRLAPVEPRDA